MAVAEELNFTRAAERLHLAQPALSRTIQELEADVGVRLLHRDRRRVALTSTGEAFLTEVRKVFVQLDNALGILRPFSTESSGIVRVGVGAALTEHLAPVLTSHDRRFPQMEIQCFDMGSSLQNAALRDQRLDVGFMRPPVDREFLDSELLFREPILALVSKTSPLATHKLIKASDLADQTIFLHERRVSTGLYDAILEIFGRAGVRPQMVQTKTGPYEDAGAMLVARGKGIFLVSGSITLGTLRRDLTTIALDDPLAFCEVHMAWRSQETSLPVLSFLESVRSVFPPRD